MHTVGLQVYGQVLAARHRRGYSMSLVGPGPWLPALSSRVRPLVTGLCSHRAPHSAFRHMSVTPATSSYCPASCPSACHPGPHGFSRLIPHILPGRSQSQRLQKAAPDRGCPGNSSLSCLRAACSGAGYFADSPGIQPSLCPEFQKHERMHHIASLRRVPPSALVPQTMASSSLFPVITPLPT